MESTQSDKSVIRLDEYKELMNLAACKKSGMKHGSEALDVKSPLSISQKPFTKRQTSGGVSKKLKNSNFIHQTNIIEPTIVIHPPKDEGLSKSKISLLTTMIEDQPDDSSQSHNSARNMENSKIWQRMEKPEGCFSDVSIYYEPEVNNVCNVSGICDIIRALDKGAIKNLYCKQNKKDEMILQVVQDEQTKKRKSVSIFSLPVSSHKSTLMKNYLDIKPEDYVPYYENENKPIENKVEQIAQEKNFEQIQTAIDNNTTNPTDVTVQKPRRKKRDDPITLLELQHVHPSAASSKVTLPNTDDINMYSICHQLSSACRVEMELSYELQKLKSNLAKYKNYNEICEKVRILEGYENDLKEDIIRNQKILNDLIEERRKIEVEYLSIQEMVQTLEYKCGNCKQLMHKKMQLEKQFNELKYQLNKAKRAKLKIRMEDKATQSDVGVERCKIVLNMLKSGLGKCSNSGDDK